MKQTRIAECKCNSLAPYSGKEANGKIEYGKNLMKHRKIYLAVSMVFITIGIVMLIKPVYVGVMSKEFAIACEGYQLLQ